MLSDMHVDMRIYVYYIYVHKNKIARILNGEREMSPTEQPLYVMFCLTACVDMAGDPMAPGPTVLEGRQRDGRLVPLAI